MTLLRGNPRRPGARPPSEPSVRYEDDTFAWALQQEAVLREGRAEAIDLMAEYPSLMNRRSEALEAAYRLGRVAALRETGLPEHALADINPCAWDSVVDRPISWPDPSSPEAHHS